MKICTNCHTSKNETEFAKSNGGKNGLRSYCKACANKYMKDYYNTKAIGRFHRLKDRARHKGIAFNITANEFKVWFDIQQLLCHYCRRQLTSRYGQHHEMTDWTFDRKDNAESYTINNLVLACRRCNMIKGEWFTKDQMLEIAKKYLRG